MITHNNQTLSPDERIAALIREECSDSEIQQTVGGQVREIAELRDRVLRGEIYAGSLSEAHVAAEMESWRAQVRRRGR